MSELLLLLLQDWTERAKRIQCPAPLPEEPVIPRLAKMLVSAPYKAPEKKAKSVGWLVRHMPRDGLSVWVPIRRRRCLETG